MNEWKKNSREEKEIDLWRFVEVLLKRAWLIALAVVIFAVCGFGYTKLFITPTYKSQFKAYITNRTLEVEVDTIDKTNTGDLNASIGLMYLYNEIIQSRSVLIAAASDVGLDYGYGTLKNMVATTMPEKASMIQVSVSAHDPEIARDLAMAIANRAIERGNVIEERSTMVVLDVPVVPSSPYAPNTTGNMLIAAVLGGVLTYALFLIVDLVNDRVKDGEDLENRYDVVVVGRIPDMATSGRTYRYGYRYGYRRYGYYRKGYGEQK
jgi:capsular polysaccharide biosynthesis protein